MPTSPFLIEAAARGFIHQCTDEAALDAALSAGPVSGYIGFDCTADSLHVGNLVQIMLLRLMQRHGHRPVALMGGGTTRIGDPSGKDEARQMLSDERIAANMAAIRRCIEPFVRFGDGPSDAAMQNNADWLDRLGYIDLLRDVGPHFTIGRMLTFDSVRLRLDREQPLTFLEFNYMILQAYDFAELARRSGVRLQMGGSDQWGNIVNGLELARRMDGAELYGLTTPLVTTADGGKMGKTAAGAVWLNADRVSPYDYWQFWRNTQDGDVIKFLKLFTDLPLADISRVGALEGAGINQAKIALATAATSLLHGEKAARAAEETAHRTFAEGASDENLPTVATGGEIGIVAALVGLGFAASNGEARRKIGEGAVRLDGETVSDPLLTIAVGGTPVKLSLGKKKHGLLTHF